MCYIRSIETHEHRGYTMNRSSLNRAIGLAMSALQQARANGQSGVATLLQSALRYLNKARNCLKRGWNDEARGYAGLALIEIKAAIDARYFIAAFN